MKVNDSLFRLKYLCFRPSVFTLLRHLQASQYWSIDEFENLRRKKQEETVLHAFNNSSFYKKLYRGVGFSPEDMRQEGWFERLPIVKKEHVRDSFDEICVQSNIRHLVVSSTGGSTGVPVRFGYDSRVPFEAYGWRMLGWWGISPADDGGYVWRNPRTSRWSIALNRALWWPTRKIKLDASSMSEESLYSFINLWNRVRPPQLQGYVGAVAELALFIESHHVDFVPPRVVWVTSAPLLPPQRVLMERVFQSPVYDQYGCCEVSHIAAQCECGGDLHVNVERVHVEFVGDKNRPAPVEQWGRTLLTKYDDPVFPLIRYEVGDTGRWLDKTCPCGRTLPIIDRVKGRTTDMIRLPSGRILSGEYLTTIFDAYPDAIRSFRVIQRKDASLMIEYIPLSDKLIEPVIEIVKKTLREKVCQEVPILFAKVDCIQHDRGKLKFVIRETYPLPTLDL